MAYRAKLLRQLTAAIALLAASNGTATACATCFNASTPGTLRAFFISTILLSAMPFAIIAGFIVLLRRNRLGPGAQRHD